MKQHPQFYPQIRYVRPPCDTLVNEEHDFLLVMTREIGTRGFLRRL